MAHCFRIRISVATRHFQDKVFAGVLCAMPFPSDGYSSIVSDRDGAERLESTKTHRHHRGLSRHRTLVRTRLARCLYDMNDAPSCGRSSAETTSRYAESSATSCWATTRHALGLPNRHRGTVRGRRRSVAHFSHPVSDGERIVVHPNDGRVPAVELDDGSIELVTRFRTNHWSWSRPTTDSPRPPMTNSSTTHRPADRQGHRAGCPLSLNSTEATSTSRNADGHRP